MHALWHWVLWVLAIGSHDPGQVELERARGAGCVTVAYAALATKPEPPKQAAKPRCDKCDGNGRIFRPDGGYVRCQCVTCADGTCRKVLP